MLQPGIRDAGTANPCCWDSQWRKLQLKTAEAAADHRALAKKLGSVMAEAATSGDCASTGDAGSYNGAWRANDAATNTEPA